MEWHIVVSKTQPKVSQPSVQQSETIYVPNHHLVDSSTLKIEKDLYIAHQVRASGVPNKSGCRILIDSGFNLSNMTSLLKDYPDNDIIEWIRFGFSMSRDPTAPDPIPAVINHRGALMFPNDISQYLQEEIRLGATIGPFTIPPFINRIGISPLNSQE